MGDTKTTNTTSGLDLLLGINTSKTESPNGTGYGAGNNQREANQSSYDHCQRADPNDSQYVPKK